MPPRTAASTAACQAGDGAGGLDHDVGAHARRWPRRRARPARAAAPSAARSRAAVRRRCRSAIDLGGAARFRHGHREQRRSVPPRSRDALAGARRRRGAMACQATAAGSTSAAVAHDSPAGSARSIARRQRDAAGERALAVREARGASRGRSPPGERFGRSAGYGRRRRPVRVPGCTATGVPAAGRYRRRRLRATVPDHLVPEEHRARAGSTPRRRRAASSAGRSRRCRRRRCRHGLVRRRARVRRSARCGGRPAAWTTTARFVSRIAHSHTTAVMPPSTYSDLAVDEVDAPRWRGTPPRRPGPPRSPQRPAGVRPRTQAENVASSTRAASARSRSSRERSR